MRSIILAVCLAALLSASLAAQQTQLATAGEEYAASPLQRRWLGDGYRDLWTTPVEAPLLDLSTDGGGLEAVRQVGSQQTAGLALRGTDGQSYTFRSLHKEPDRVLPAEWRRSWPARLLRDATSATHPGAALIVPVLAEAAGIPHTWPRLVVMPDDPRLGAFRAAFALKLGTFEEFPTTGFAGATEIISTRELWVRWLRGPENRIDSRAYLRARILDLFVDNYDRHRGQWRWMRLPDSLAWRALPEDPDMAFVRHDGLVKSSMRARQPRLLEFSETFPSNLEGPTVNPADIDRWLLADLDRSTYDALARELQAAWTNEVIDRAVAQLPEEWRAKNAAFLAAALRHRRDALVSYVLRIYRYLAREVDLQLTDRDEQVSIHAAGDGTVTVKVSVPNAATPHLARTFTPDETADVRVFVRGGYDVVRRTGRASRIRVRVIAGAGAKEIDSADIATEVWHDGGTVDGRRLDVRGPWTNPSPVADAPWVEPRSFGSLTLWQPTAWVAPDLGLVAGIGYLHETYGFRSAPFARQHALRGVYALGERNGRFEYAGIFNRAGSGLSLDLRTFGSGIERINYFGLGNDTPAQSRRARYRSFQTAFGVAPAVRVQWRPQAALTLGPELRYSNSAKEPGSVLFDEAPYGTGPFTQVTLRGAVEVDTRPAQPGVLMALSAGQPPADANASRAFDLRTSISAEVSPPVGDVDEAYGALDGHVAAYATRGDTRFATRVGGRRLWGRFPWFDAAFLGGQTHRGFRTQRFAGDAAFYANVDVSSFVGRPVLSSMFPLRLGVIGVVDLGRVWLAGKPSHRWHASAGGGLLVKPLGTAVVLRLVAARGGEGTLVYAGSGFQF